MTPEAKVRNPVVAWAKAHGILHVRMSFRPGVATGVPDDLFLLPNGWACWIEFKRDGKSPTPKQFEKIAALHARGHLATWFDNKVGAINWLELILLREPKRR